MALLEGRGASCGSYDPGDVEESQNAGEAACRIREQLRGPFAICLLNMFRCLSAKFLDQRFRATDDIIDNLEVPLEVGHDLFHLQMLEGAPSKEAASAMLPDRDQEDRPTRGNHPEGAQS